MLSQTIVAVHLILLVSAMSLASAAENRVEMVVNETQRCFSANGLPDHPTGQFPNRGNPNAIAAQQVEVCVTKNPVRGEAPNYLTGTTGIAINGVQFRPSTAGFWDPDHPRGHSREGDRNWSLDIHGVAGKLGLDMSNAHVGRGGLYHYHGIAKSLLLKSGTSLIGYAADGFEIHYVGGKVRSGYQLKPGTRPSGPGGAYDGTYNEDFEFVAGRGLDECNGGLLDGAYVYFVTDTYPYVQRCVWGAVSPDLGRSRHR